MHAGSITPTSTSIVTRYSSRPTILQTSFISTTSSTISTCSFDFLSVWEEPCNSMYISLNEEGLIARKFVYFRYQSKLENFYEDLLNFASTYVYSKGSYTMDIRPLTYVYKDYQSGFTSIQSHCCILKKKTWSSYSSIQLHYCTLLGG